jgi:hypothetical protein
MKLPMKQRFYIVQGETPVFISLLVSLGIILVTIISLWAFPIVPMLKDHMAIETAVVLAPATGN